MSSLGLELTLEFEEPVSAEALSGIVLFGARKVAMNVVRQQVATLHVAYLAWYASLLEIEEFLFDLGRMAEAKAVIELGAVEEASAMRWWPLEKRRPSLRLDLERPERRVSDVYRFRFVNGETLQARLVELFEGPDPKAFLETPSGVRLGFSLAGLTWYGPLRVEP